MLIQRDCCGFELAQLLFGSIEALEIESREFGSDSACSSLNVASAPSSSAMRLVEPVALGSEKEAKRLGEAGSLLEIFVEVEAGELVGDAGRLRAPLA